MSGILATIFIASQNTYCFIVEHHFFERHEVGEREEDVKHFTIQLVSSRSTRLKQQSVSFTDRPWSKSTININTNSSYKKLYSYSVMPKSCNSRRTVTGCLQIQP